MVGVNTFHLQAAQVIFFAGDSNQARIVLGRLIGQLR